MGAVYCLIPQEGCKKLLFMSNAEGLKWVATLHRVPASFRTLKGKFRLIRIGGALEEAYALIAYCRQRTLAAKSCNFVKDRPSNFFKRFSRACFKFVSNFTFLIVLLMSNELFLDLLVCLWMILMAHSYEDFLIILVFRNENPPDFSAVFLTGNKFQIKTRDNLICN